MQKLALGNVDYYEIQKQDDYHWEIIAVWLIPPSLNFSQEIKATSAVRELCTLEECLDFLNSNMEKPIRAEIITPAFTCTVRFL